jgi:uncharacterized membrane protein
MWLLCAIYVTDKPVRFINNQTIVDESADKQRRIVPRLYVLGLMVLCLMGSVYVYFVFRQHVTRDTQVENM